MADFAQTLMTTLAVGSLYALIALGYTMVYGILKFINFAHSDIVVLGAWISYTLATVRFCPRSASIRTTRRCRRRSGSARSILIASMVVCGFIGFLDRAARLQAAAQSAAAQRADHGDRRVAVACRMWGSSISCSAPARRRCRRCCRIGNCLRAVAAERRRQPRRGDRAGRRDDHRHVGRC